MGYLKYLKETWKKPRETLGQQYKDMLFNYRRENVVTRLEKPTRIDRARALGYKAKQGFVIARVRVVRGGKSNPKDIKGRDGGNQSTKISQSKNYQWIAEEKAEKRFPNLEVINSYWVAQDEKYYWYEMIMVDVYHPQIISDKEINWVISNKHTKRASRALTSSAKKSRGLNKKGIGSEKARPSLRSNNRRLR